MTTQPNKHTRPLCAPLTINTPASTTPQSLSALLPFGLLPTPQSKDRKDHAHQCKISSGLLTKIQSSPLTLITGPSGSGKSTLLRALQTTLPNTITPTDLPKINQSLPIVNLFNQPLNKTLSLLSSTGLAEPKLWPLPQHALSTGEQARLQIARLLSTATPNTHIILDELATPLDRLTARALCASLNKIITRSSTAQPIKIIAAAAHEDLPTFLDTTLLINPSTQTILPTQYTKETITYEPGNINDYHALKHHHYIQSHPVSIAQINRAIRHCPVTQTQTLAGILVVAYPTLNSAHRDRAWPNRYTTKNKSKNAHRVNTELRRIARVIIDPRSRGLGIASTLVRNYLANPLTQATEAIAAMGSINPFFKAAGMTQYPIPHHPTDLRLLDTLHHLNLTPQDLLQTNPPLPPACPSPAPTGEVAESSRSEGVFSFSSPLPPLLTRELKTWARAKNLNPNDPNLPQYAAFKLLTKPCAYTHVNQEQEHNA